MDGSPLVSPPGIVGRGTALAATGEQVSLAATGVRRWSDRATWGGELPQAGSRVRIPRKATVILDTSPPPLGDLRIDGALVFADRDLDLVSHSIMVHGRLEVGSADHPFRSRAVVTLTGQPQKTSSSPVGVKVLSVMGGTLELHGDPRGPSWTRLAKTARAGSNRLVLEQPVDWKPGDLVVVASTDYNPLQAEEAIVTAVKGQVVALDRPLAYMHWGERQTLDGTTIDERAEVGRLSRNVVVQGDKGSAGSGFGGHVMIMAGSTVHVEWTEFQRLGQKSQLGRYPVHFHLAGDASGSYVKSSSIHHSFNRCLTIHGTHGVVAQSNVAYDTIGHCYFLEDGVERQNVLDANLGLVTRSAASGEELLSSDATPATFWISHPSNAFRNNVAAGSQAFGFWFLMPEHPTGPSQTPKNDREVWPRRTPLGEFNGNIAHSSDDTGLFVDTDKADDEFTYAPHSNPIPPAADQEDSPAVPAEFANFKAYKNRQRGVWLRGERLVVRGAALADNAIGATFASVDTTIRNSLIVGETANRGSPEPGETLGLDGRTLPTPDQPNFPIRGFEFFWEHVGARHVTFVNFQPNRQRQASALGYLVDNPYGINVRNFAEGVRFVNANPVYLVEPNPKTDGDKSAVFYDMDGSVTGASGQYVVANNPFLLTSSCTRRSAWNAHVCHSTAYGRMSVSPAADPPADIGPLIVRRDDGGAQSVLVGLGEEGKPASTFQTSVIFGKAYQVYWKGAEPPRLTVSVEFGRPGDWVGLALPYRSTTFEIHRNGDESQSFKRVTTLAGLEAHGGNAYYADGRFLYVKLTLQEADDGSVELDIRRR